MATYDFDETIELLETEVAKTYLWQKQAYKLPAVTAVATPA